MLRNAIYFDIIFFLFLFLSLNVMFVSKIALRKGNTLENDKSLDIDELFKTRLS